METNEANTMFITGFQTFREPTQLQEESRQYNTLEIIAVTTDLNASNIQCTITSGGIGTSSTTLIVQGEWLTCYV